MWWVEGGGLFRKLSLLRLMVKETCWGQWRVDSIDFKVFLVKSGGFKNSLEQCFTVFLKKTCFQWMFTNFKFVKISLILKYENVIFRVLGLSTWKVWVAITWYTLLGEAEFWVGGCAFERSSFGWINTFFKQLYCIIIGIQ